MVSMELLPLFYRVILPITINKLVLPHKFYVFQELHKDIILGLDFLNYHCVDILLSEQCVKIRGGLTEAALTPFPLRNTVARIEGQVDLPPMSESALSLTVPLEITAGATLLVNPHPSLASRTNLLGSRCIATCIHNGKASVTYRLMNPQTAMLS